MYGIAPRTPLACQPHDHNQCVSTALVEVDTLCVHQDARLTELRRYVLELVWQSYRPLEAYDIPAVLSETNGRCVAPLTVYRAPDLLQEDGLIHRIASLNAFVGCSNPEHSYQGQFLICHACHTVIEPEQLGIGQAIVARASSVGFIVENQTVEVAGLCGTCRGQKDA